MISIDTAQEFALLRLEGDFDLADARALEEALENLDSEPVIIVSLEAARLLDSTIISAFVQANATHAGNLVVVLPARALDERSSTIPGFRECFRFAPTLPDAVAVARTFRDVAAATFSRDGAVTARQDLP